MWSNNKPWGYGILKLDNGDIYEGLFRNGYKHGTGVENYSRGGSYIGNFRDGQPEGHGKLIDYDGSIFVGQFRKGQKHGRGNWTIPITEERKVEGKIIKLLLVEELSRQATAKYSGDMENGKLCGNG